MISILLSVYNAEPYLSDVLNSVSNQTLTDYEFIIVDDGSTDKTGHILDVASKSDTRLKVYKIDNLGLANALNFGLTKCRRRFVARIDADDYWAPSKLQHQLDFMIKEDLDLSSTGFYTSKNNVLKKYTPRFKTSKQLNAHLWRMRPIVAHSTLMYRTTAIEALGGYRALFKLAEDFDLLLRFSEEFKCSSLNMPLSTIRKPSDSISATAGSLAQLFDALLSLAASEGFITPPELYTHRTKTAVTYRNRELERYRNTVFERTWGNAEIYGSHPADLVRRVYFKSKQHLMQRRTKALLKELYDEDIS